MTRRIVASLMLAIIALFLLWYGYQGYKRYQKPTIVYSEVSGNKK